MQGEDGEFKLDTSSHVTEDNSVCPDPGSDRNSGKNDADPDAAVPDAAVPGAADPDAADPAVTADVTEQRENTIVFNALHFLGLQIITELKWRFKNRFTKSY